MNGKKFVVGMIAFAMIFAILGSVMAQYDDTVTDPEGDVMRYVDDDSYIYVENPDIDIIKAQISEDDGTVTVTLRVKGTITDHEDIHYEIHMTCDYDGDFEIKYNNGEVHMTSERFTGSGAHGNPDVPTVVSGAGTHTLSVSFELEHIGEPGDLEFVLLVAFDEGKFEVDLAGPMGIPEGDLIDDDDVPDNGDDPVDDDDDNGDDAPDNGDDAPDNGDEEADDDDDEEDTPGFLFGMLVLSIALLAIFYKKKQ